MTKAFVDTTILVDRLLKPGPKRESAIAALGRFDETLLPVYAIKEFRTGALKNYIWAHNALVESKNVENFILRAQKIRQRNLSSSAIEALGVAFGLVPDQNLDGLVNKYGTSAKPKKIQYDAIRLQLRSIIFRSWKNRRQVTSSISGELSCFQEEGPFERRGLLELKRRLRPCGSSPDCAIAKMMGLNLAAIKALIDSNDGLPNNAEKHQRERALRHLYRTPKRPLPEKYCRGLGDAVFAFFAPNDSVILTTNINDHGPLAASLGKTATEP